MGVDAKRCGSLMMAVPFRLTWACRAQMRASPTPGGTCRLTAFLFLSSHPHRSCYVCVYPMM